MAGSPVGKGLRHVRSLLTVQGVADAPDGQLLERFAVARDEAAFDALLRRHGPMVLGVCRRVLHDEHDAEDVFQATFLMLARKAGSVRKGESLGCWLHSVARRLAVKVRTQRKHRREREQQVAAMAKTVTNLEMAWRELQEVLDGALQGLPEKYRSALVLCYLEGRTQEDVARQVGCPLGTVRSRLAQGRKLLRDRLARRGLAPTAGALTAALATATASAAVPAALRNPLVRAAARLAAGEGLGSLVSTRVAALVEGGLPSALGAKSKLALVLLMTGLLALGAGTAAAPPRNEAGLPQPAGGPPAPAAQPGPPAETKEVAVAGRVFTLDGKPLAGASVAAEAYFPSRLPRGGTQLLGPIPTGPDGRYRLVVPVPAADERFLVFLRATADGYGLGSQFYDSTDAQPKTDIGLVAEWPVRVRLVSLEGAAAAGAEVTFSLPNYGVMPTGPSWRGRATTDDRGRFTLRGVGRGTRVWLEIRDGRFACQRLELETGAKKEGEEVLLTLAPPRPIEGRVIAQDTRQPLANVRVDVHASKDNNRTGNVEGRTDEQGRYRIIPFTGSHFAVRVFPGEGVPYLPWEEQFEWPKGGLRRTVDLTLSRGVLVRGRVTEGGSGKPVAGAAVTYRPRRRQNPFYRRGLLEYMLAIHPTPTGPDGTFQLAALPGPGHLLVQGPTPDYLHVETSLRELETGKPGGLRLYPDGLLGLDLKPNTAPPEARIPLRRGVTVKGRVLRPGGQPAPEGLVMCRTYHPFGIIFGHNIRPVHNGAFEVPGCDPEKAQPVYFLDVKDQLGAMAELSGKQAREAVTVRLAPCGSATVRFVDGDGKPLANQPVGPHPLFVHLHLVVTPGLTVWTMPDTEMLQSDTAMQVNFDPQRYGALRTDAAGRVTFPTLLPGATYHLVTDENLGTARKEFTAKAGQTVDLGDVTMKRTAD
jgi:RNA polymerase sigma factor (sigma-70 family)